MVGLIQKDMCVLRRQLLTLLEVAIGITVLGVLFFLSAKYGNIAKELASMESEPNGEAMFFVAYRMTIWMILLIPMTFLTTIQECFKADIQAGFSVVAGSMPISKRTLVCARYVGSMLLSLFCLGVSLLAGGMVAVTTDAFAFSEIARWCLCAFAGLVIYNMIIFPLLYWFRGKRMDLIMLIPLLTVGMYIIIKGGQLDDAELTEALIYLGEHAADYTWILLGIMVVCVGISCGISVWLEERRGPGK